MHHQLSYVPLIGPAPTVDSTMDLSEARQRRLISRRGRLPPEHGGKVLAADKARQIKCSYDIGFSKSNRFDGGRVPALSEYIASQRSAASRAPRASTARAVSAGVSRHAGGGGAQSSLLSDVSMSRASARSQASVRERPSTTTAASRRHDQDRRTEAEKWGVSERNLLYRKMVVGGHDPPAFSFGQAGRFRVPRTGGYNAGEHKLCFSTVRHDRRSWRKPFYLDRGTKRGGAGGGGGGGRGGRKGAANSVDLPLPGGGDRLQHALGRTRSLAVAAKFAPSVVAVSMNSRLAQRPEKHTRVPPPGSYNPVDVNPGAGSWAVDWNPPTYAHENRLRGSDNQAKPKRSPQRLSPNYKDKRSNVRRIPSHRF